MLLLSVVGCAIFREPRFSKAALDTGNDFCAVNVYAGGVVELSDISFIGNPTFNPTVRVVDQALLYLLYFGTGTVTGKRFVVESGGLINSFGYGLNAIPGTVAGTADNANGAYYVL